MWRRLIAPALLAALIADLGVAQKKKGKKDRDEITQTLEVPPDPPAAVKVESSRLAFYTSQLSSKGLLSQQAKEALSSIRRQAKGGTIVKVRAFVAGRGDSRRVGSIVGEQFSEWKLPLPALSVIQVGALPMEGAQVWIEGIAEDRRPVNLNGVEWLDSKQVTKPLEESGALAAVGPLLAESLDALKGELLSLTCFVSSLDGADGLDRAIAAKFPGVPHTLLQAQRATGSGLARCEGVSRRSTGDAPRQVLTGTLIGFGYEAKDIQSTLDRLTKLLEANNAALLKRKSYGVSRSFEHRLDPMIVVEGVGSNEATFAVEAIGNQP